jgi:hypothetical protein
VSYGVEVTTFVMFNIVLSVVALAATTGLLARTIATRVQS